MQRCSPPLPGSADCPHCTDSVLPALLPLCRSGCPDDHTGIDAAPLRPAVPRSDGGGHHIHTGMSRFPPQVLCAPCLHLSGCPLHHMYSGICPVSSHPGNVSAPTTDRHDHRNTPFSVRPASPSPAAFQPHICTSPHILHPIIPQAAGSHHTHTGWFSRGDR